MFNRPVIVDINLEILGKSLIGIVHVHKYVVRICQSHHIFLVKKDKIP